MKISTQIRYGVIALCEMAYGTGTEPVQINVICKKEGLPRHYMEQILHKLLKAGIVKSKRGPFGGYYLAAKPQDVRVGDVIRAIDGRDIQLEFNSGDEEESGDPGERFEKVSQEVWAEASKRLKEYFDSITIEDLCVRKQLRNHYFTLNRENAVKTTLKSRIAEAKK
jgi:Rrf2 family transcriptional regulator, iron-sulfur cluster assembly transcription factor